MENGWIKLHRKLRFKGYYRKSQYVHLWIHLLLLANHEEKEFMWNGGIIMVKEGQILTGRDELVKQTGIPGTTIERILKMLENEQQIGQQKTQKFRVITILNWREYQKSDSRVVNKRTTNGQQADTNKNDKNVKNDKNILAAASAAEEFSLKGYIKELEENPRRDMNVIALYFEERKPDLKTIEQARIAVRRHLRAAKDLKDFTDEQILKGVEKAKKQTPEWTIETIVKMLTK